MSKHTENATLRREREILDRLENVRRLIEMEATITTATGAKRFCNYMMTDRAGNKLSKILLTELRDEIQLQLLSITALCFGDNPSIGEAGAMLEWAGTVDGENASDLFHNTWEKCLQWNA